MEVREVRKMDNERMQILQMLADKKITATEAGHLLEALEEGEEKPIPGGHAKWIRIRVWDAKSNKAKVNVNLPIALVDIALQIGTKFVPEEHFEAMGDIDIKEVFRAIKEGARGKLVEVEDDEEGVRVEIVVE